MQQWLLLKGAKRIIIGGAHGGEVRRAHRETMFANSGIGTHSLAQAAAATSAVCNEVRPCFACALDDFAKETAPTRDAESERVFQFFCILLKQYLNTFGAALLAANGVAMTVVPGKRQPESVQPIEKYTPADFVPLLRGFALFFVLFKVEAPDDVKEAWWALTRQLSRWLIRRGFMRADFQLSLEAPDDETKINALCAAAVINEAAEQHPWSDPSLHKMRHGEPFYMVSRVVPGKLWFLHSPGKGKCAEFGPVAVPPVVANFVEPGWAFECKFVSIGGRWHIVRVTDVLPV